MLPQRKDSAKFAKSKLLIQFNDIDIYIEDTAKNYGKIYVNIFQRVFSEKYKINNVYPIGARGNVIKKCRDITDKTSRPVLFLVDGDLYLLKGENPLPHGVFRLPAYCIENILLDVNAIIDYLYEEHPSLKMDDIISSFCYDDWVKQCKEPLVRLFIIYAAIQKLNIQGQPNVSIPIDEFISKQNNSIVDQASIENKIAELESEIIAAVGKKKYQATVDNIKSNFDTSVCHLMTYVSGKDYLYPLLYNKASSTLKKPIAHINFKQRLALKCDVEKLKACHSHVLVPNA